VSLPPLPSLDELAAQPERARDLPPKVAAELLARVAGLQPVLLARALAPQGDSQPEAPAGDRLMTPEESARLLSVTPEWLYRRSKSHPYARHLSRKCLRFSEAGLRKWQAAKRA
jgi:hypothetical protein